MDNHGAPIDPYAINMLSGTLVATHVFLLHADMAALMQDPVLQFNSTLVCMHILLWP